MLSIFLIFALVIAALAVIFAVQNVATVTITFIAWQVTASLSLVLLATLIIGTVIGLLVLAPSAIKGTMTASSHRKRIETLEKQLDEHRQKITEMQETVPAAPESESATSPPQESS